MPLIHCRTFRVRHYECDANGRVKHANYLRYMQEAALDASAAAGYDTARYQAIGCSWSIRETEIEYVRPLHYGDSVQVKTWVVDFRHVRSRRAYEIHVMGTGELVAQAVTDWAFLETASGRPIVIPGELRAAFFPEGVPDCYPARARFPATSPPASGAFHQQRRVEWRDLDPAGHVNNAVHLAYIEECGLRMLAAHGWSIARMAAAGFTVVARQHRIEYRLPALLDEELELTTWIYDAQGSTAVRCSTIKRVSDGALLVRARTVHVWVDVETGRAVAIPETFLGDLASDTREV
jgi:acyl-CoA thioester hydrolase